MKRLQLMRNRYFLAVVIFMLTLVAAYGQGVRGKIKATDGEALPFASIYVKERGMGTTSNLEGNYELKLDPGAYELTFQFMGYETQVKRITIDNDFKTLDIILSPQVISLGSVTVTGKQEDPSYTIMRKAIAKSKYHLLQYDNYSAKVYMKGTGRLVKAPWFLRKKLEKEGVDSTQVFTSESVSEIFFEQPNVFKERVISVRSSGEGNENASPNAYINSSFYLPKVVNSISPLSPRAFAYYKFEYQGSFRERGYEINKIKVTPRSKGDDLFEGEIYIRENFWNIHSLDLTTGIYGFRLQIQQIFAPIQEEIWMPVTQKFDFSGSMIGFAVEYKYLASVSDYQVTLNADLVANVMLVDEKIEEVPEEINAIKQGDTDEGVKEVFEENKEVSRKQFRKLMKAYEKESLEVQEEPDVISDRTYTIDSTAYKNDSIYWANIRPVPLTVREVQGYHRDDSTYIAEKEKAEADSSKAKNGESFKWTDLLFGGYYQLGSRLRFSFDSPLEHFGFNTVEGWNINLGGTFRWRNDSTARLRISPAFRYGFASDQFYGKLKTSFSLGKKGRQNNFIVEGGKYIHEFYPGAIDPLINAVYSLFYEKNFMKLYEKDYVEVRYRRKLGNKWRMNASLEWANRSELFNNTNYSIVNNKDRAYSSNLPSNNETSAGGYQDSKAFITSINFSYRPWLKYRKYNGRRIPVESSSPVFKFNYRKGINDLLESQVDFDHMELGSDFSFRLGVRAKIDVKLQAGTFFNDPTLLFPDFKHFQGSRIEVAPLSVTGGYRLLHYYKYSTQDDYLSAFSYFRFRKFLFTQLPLLRFSGLKENLFLNYLNTQTSDHYTEVGYTIDNIFRIFRLEFVQSFRDWEVAEFGVRVGVSSIFGDD